jgi:hypothetical protein
MRNLLRPSGAGFVVLAAAGVLADSASAADRGFRVLHHESVSVTREALVGANERMRFEAYGRRFELNLSPNERIRRGIRGGADRLVPLQGTVDGIPNSWVRVTRSASGVRGMVFDGEQHYAIEPAAEIAPLVVQPLNAATGGTVVYRLSDALMPVETMKCELASPSASSTAEQTAADALQTLSTELREFQAAAAVSAIRQVRVGVIGDFEFVSQFIGIQPEDAIVARMNIVDGIFTSQVGVKISLAPSTLFTTPTDPFTKSNASELLDELRAYRNGSPTQRSLGITHLMTGRNLETQTVGIAYISGVCNAEFGTSLSQSGLDTNRAALIAAHEIGHNFGAPHDGEGACATTSTTCTPGASPPTCFLMAPQLNNMPDFSACSIQQMQPTLNGASCLTTYNPPDASIVVSTPNLSATVGTAMFASFTVRAGGDDASSNVAVNVSIPPNVTIQSVAANGGTCTTGAGIASCTIGTLAAGDARQVDLGLTPTAAGTLSLNLQVTSSNDSNTINDTGLITITAGDGSSAPPGNPPPSGAIDSGGGGGGGGRLDLALFAVLAAALMAASIRHRRRPLL